MVDRYARKLPLAVISELLGVPAEDRPKFIGWASGFTRFTGMVGFLAAIPNILARRRDWNGISTPSGDPAGKG